MIFLKVASSMFLALLYITISGMITHEIVEYPNQENLAWLITFKIIEFLVIGYLIFEGVTG